MLHLVGALILDGVRHCRSVLVGPVGRSPFTHRNCPVAEEAPYIGVLVPCKALREEMPVARFSRTIHVSVRQEWNRSDRLERAAHQFV